ncbi:hypothetical protein [Novosphingobium sp.]|uniref:hypothetical protein n=1 Tax=Novosphingobium sp. TaxID=1874826 RepID=UPI002FE270C3
MTDNGLGRRPDGFFEADVPMGRWGTDPLEPDLLGLPSVMMTFPLADNAVVLRDGRYDGSNPQLRVDLRLDAAGAGVASFDIYRREHFGETFVASGRSAPGKSISGASGNWQVIVEGASQQSATGGLQLDASTPERAIATLSLDALIDGLAHSTPMAFLCEWRSPFLRRLGLEIDSEVNVQPPPTATIGGVARSIALALQAAGFDTYGAGTATQIPAAPDGGWSEKSLEHLMRTYAQSDLSRPSFDLRLLWLARSNRPGLLGVMFDSDDELPRQGLAVFAEEIRDRFGADADRKLIQTTVHEIGHALNLAHRFEREVGRADSTSFMNYDWRFRGGGAANEFWSAFNFSFDTDELIFLRHGGLRNVSPGGAAFHSVRYWADGNGGYSPYVPETELPGFRIELILPEQGPLFRFGQPVFLGIKLTNTSGRPVDIPEFLLDAKAGFLEFMIRRLDLSDPEHGERRSFSPIIDRCYDASPDRAIRLDPGVSHSDNVQLHFGAGGFAFAEPGFYEVTALLVIYDRQAERDMITRSSTIRLRVAHPQGEEERDAFTLFDHATGRWFALGGTLNTRANDAVQELLEQRMSRVRGRSRALSIADGVERDPIVANIVRLSAFQANRTYPAAEKGKIVEFSAPDFERSRSLAEALTDRALTWFDPITFAATARYRDEIIAKA